MVSLCIFLLSFSLCFFILPPAMYRIISLEALVYSLSLPPKVNKANNYSNTSVMIQRSLHTRHAGPPFIHPLVRSMSSTAINHHGQFENQDDNYVEVSWKSQNVSHCVQNPRQGVSVLCVNTVPVHLLDWQFIYAMFANR